MVNNLNYGIDFKGGILLELRSKNLIHQILMS